MDCVICGAELKVYDIEVQEVQLPTDGQGYIEYSWGTHRIGAACGEAIPEDIYACAEAARVAVAKVVGSGYVACDCEVCPYKVEDGTIVPNSSIINARSEGTINTHVV